MKKVQVSTAVHSEGASFTPVTDDLPGDEAQSSTSIEDGEDDYILPVSSPVEDVSLPLPQDVAQPTATTEAVKPLPGDFGGAHPCVPTAAVGSSHRKKALPQRSTRT